MANIKYQINETPEQIERLKKALHVGSPLDNALKYAGISKSTYYYWVAIASIVKYAKEQDFAKQQEDAVHSGVSFAAIKESIQAENNEKQDYKGTIDAFVEPSMESMLRYKNNRSFKEFADRVYNIINECDQLRSEIVLYHLTAIRDAARQRGANANASQWFLERTCPEYFGRTSKFGEEAQESKKQVEKVTVEFVSPYDKESQDRINDMTQLVESQMGIDVPKS